MTVIYEDKILKVLCLITKIMIYRLPVRDSIDRSRVDNFKEELKEILNEENDSNEIENLYKELYGE